MKDELSIYTVTLTPPASMSDLHGYLRPAGAQGLLLTAATGQLDTLNASRETTVALIGAVWVLARIRMEFYRPIPYEKPVEVSTWSADAKGAGFQRETTFTVEGELLGRAASVWCLADVEGHRMLRPSALTDRVDLHTTGLATFPAPGKLRLPNREGEPYLHTVRYSDVDVNGHLHNARYTDLCCDALALETTDRWVREFQINYTAECKPGETIALYTEREEDHALLCGVGPEGKVRFEAEFFLA